ncbi:hypothetical protein [Bacillus pseudomycoides]|uniref:Uncharacterized protein n=1 Tax=Bacillus pseudomycoides TaxID=64104 RepID=A0A2B5QHR2_9BACI|nr:hypothetical protein [Bacillus pseudomycoides]PDY46406.1 hypothetical protein CON79_15075 [Bacillus pseudomycoides]PEA81185.1 hypothetical protein CON99_24030 [Bacillus pseudomycoides]PED08465.1 hypothetical protein COO19_09895 [Bacillus pseudomycoides]PED69663.1 hypothetical protein CON97_23850 [Bacillus pseudomycoides]PEI43992.1 hypothetical protein CN620_06435 [Bacillus pseudomycoides]
MNIKKTVIIAIALAIIALFMLIFSQTTEDGTIEKYIKDKYSIDVIVTKWGSINGGNGGHTWHTVQVKDNKNIQFQVEVNGLFNSTIIGDDYENGLKINEEYKKFKPLLNEIEKLGYIPVPDENVIQYIIDDMEESHRKVPSELFVMLKSVQNLDYSQFETKELDRLFALLQIVQNNNKQITKIEILDNKDKLPHLNLENIQEIKSKDQLLFAMKNASEEYWNNLILTQIHDKMKEIENDYVTFKSISCNHIENEECKTYKVILQFKDDMLNYKKNPQLIDDIYKVSSLLQTEKPNNNFEMEFVNTGKSSYTRSLLRNQLQTREQIETAVKKFLVEE